MFHNIDDVRIKGLRPLISPSLIIDELPISEASAVTVENARAACSHIIHDKDDRLAVVVGPCSIHDNKAALEYAKKLAELNKKLEKDLLIIMRIYFEKPRTTIGWKGLINDPDLNNTFNINKGLRIARNILRDVTDLGLPAATEFLDTIIPQYISDLVSWGAIGARTTESQIHRELASGLSMPIGFKNGTDGNVKIAIDAVGAAIGSHHFLSVTKHSLAAIVSTTGNKDCHIILRGSTNGPNYDAQHIKQCLDDLKSANVPAKIMVDCSHGNSNKDHTKQALVIEDICKQVSEGENGIMGVMLESNLVAGKQAHKQDIELTYGQSITDACISWDETVPLLEKLAQAVRARRK